jgi:hypothetical protein
LENWEDCFQIFSTRNSAYLFEINWDRQGKSQRVTWLKYSQIENQKLQITNLQNLKMFLKTHL